MSYVDIEQIERAREMDLLTYLRLKEPDELIQVSGDNYMLKTHDSLKLSNGKWYWWSRGIGGTNALDFLTKVRGYYFPDAVLEILGELSHSPTLGREMIFLNREKTAAKIFTLPKANPDNRRVFAYLCKRGIDPEIINHFIKHKMLYEEAARHNCVFVGHSPDNTPKYAALRGTYSDSLFVGEVEGSNKRYGFSASYGDGKTLYVYESAIDLLSYLTLRKMVDRNWRYGEHMSLGSVQERIKKLPSALNQRLIDYPDIEMIVLLLDNDVAGRAASRFISENLNDIKVVIHRPGEAKDINELLQNQVGISNRVQMRKSKQKGGDAR